MQYTLKVNGETHEVDVDADTPLLWVIRDSLGMTGTKFACGITMCGACTVHVDGVATRSCMYPIEEVGDQEITTVEGLNTPVADAVKNAWIENDVPQCGYCQTGMVMAATSLLNEIPEPTDEDIDQHVSNMCRCGTYARVRKAIHEAASAAKA